MASSQNKQRLLSMNKQIKRLCPSSHFFGYKYTIAELGLPRTHYNAKPAVRVTQSRVLESGLEKLDFKGGKRRDKGVVTESPDDLT